MLFQFLGHSSFDIMVPSYFRDLKRAFVREAMSNEVVDMEPI